MVLATSVGYAKSFGEKLRFDRESEGLSLTELARSVGVTPSYLSKVERDKVKQPSITVLERICRSLGWKFSEILELFSDPKEREIDEEIRRLEMIMPLERFLFDAYRELNPTLSDKRFFLRLLEEMTRD